MISQSDHILAPVSVAMATALCAVARLDEAHELQEEALARFLMGLTTATEAEAIASRMTRSAEGRSQLIRLRGQFKQWASGRRDESAGEPSIQAIWGSCIQNLTGELSKARRNPISQSVILRAFLQRVVESIRASQTQAPAFARDGLAKIEVRGIQGSAQLELAENGRFLASAKVQGGSSESLQLELIEPSGIGIVLAQNQVVNGRWQVELPYFESFSSQLTGLSGGSFRVSPSGSDWPVPLNEIPLAGHWPDGEIIHFFMKQSPYVHGETFVMHLRVAYGEVNLDRGYHLQVFLPMFDTAVLVHTEPFIGWGEDYQEIRFPLPKAPDGQWPGVSMLILSLYEDNGHN